MGSEESTERTVRKKKEQSSPLDIGRNGIIILVALLLAAAMFMVFTGGDTTTSGNTADTGKHTGDGSESGFNQPVVNDTATATATIEADIIIETTNENEIVDPAKSGDGFEAEADVSEEKVVTTDSRLLKKIGPFDLPPYGEKVNEITYVVQSESFSLDDGSGCGVGITSTRDPGISFSGFPTKEVIVLLILRDDSGNCIPQSKVDETTGDLYFARMIVDTNPTTPLYKEDQVKISVEEKRKAQTWEVLVYSY